MKDHDTGRCRELFSHLSDYLDGDLDAAICSEIDVHLEDCAPCVAFLDSLRRTVRMLEASPGRTMPADVKREVLDAAARIREGRTR